MGLDCLSGLVVLYNKICTLLASNDRSSFAIVFGTSVLEIVVVLLVVNVPCLLISGEKFSFGGGQTSTVIVLQC